MSLQQYDISPDMLLAKKMHIAGLQSICLIWFIAFGADADATERWYKQAQVDHGQRLFQQHCAQCHGENAEGTLEWKKTDANGNYPPPPLNGNAHAWHHSIPQLARYIREGGIKIGGVMPGFGNQLGDQQVLALIAFFQSKWPDELYARWHTHFMQ